MKLDNKVVVITGSSDGIGAEAAKFFAKEKAKVVVCYNSQKEKAENIYRKCKRFNDALLVKLDVSDKSSIENCIDEIMDKYGNIDVLVNNAGVMFWENFSEQSFEEIDKQIDVNLKGLIKMTKYALPYMKDGIIINISSGAGKQGFAGLATYCATKFGVRGFTQALSQEPSRGMRFYSVNPGMTSTKMTNYRGISPEIVGRIILETAKESLGKKSGDDVDVWDYV